MSLMGCGEMVSSKDGFLPPLPRTSVTEDPLGV
jgi:hypothetical protein